MNLYIFYCTMHCSNPAFGCQILINFLSCLVTCGIQNMRCTFSDMISTDMYSYGSVARVELCSVRMSLQCRLLRVVLQQVPCECVIYCFSLLLFVVVAVWLSVNRAVFVWKDLSMSFCSVLCAYI